MPNDSSIDGAKIDGCGVVARHPQKVQLGDHRVDTSEVFEFGGVWGTGFVMVLFPLLMWYVWVGQKHYGGQLPLPSTDEKLGDFVNRIAGLAYEVSRLTQNNLKHSFKG